MYKYVGFIYVFVYKYEGFIYVFVYKYEMWWWYDIGFIYVFVYNFVNIIFLVFRVSFGYWGIVEESSLF